MNLSFFKKHKIVSGLLVFVLVLVILALLFLEDPTTKIPKERNYPDYIKGLTVVDNSLASDVPQIKSDNINTISLYPAIHSRSPFQKSDILKFIKEAKKNGIAIHLGPTIFAPDPPNPKAVDEEELAQYTKKVIDWAKFSEKYGVEYFTPITEVDFALCADRALTWQEQILPEIRKVYSGEVHAQYASNHRDCMDDWMTDSEQVSYWVEIVKASHDFDGVLLDIFPPTNKENLEDFYANLEEIVKATSIEAKELNIKIGIGEFGIPIAKPKEFEHLIPGPVVSVEEQLEFTEKFLDIVMPHYDAVYYGAWDAPDYGMKDKPVEKVIRERFK